ncbi:MAG: DNA mismatch repair endonuclease MutL [Armatimonadetes bacterium]|nr:DNA mismatch repair endonuclease MutL [Armatimonadota bacterium]
MASTEIPRTGKIQLLDNVTINQIAAGEVVERPAAALKELLENSIDAGAKRITIDLEEAGRALIQIQDDGIGMEPEEAKMSLLRHATSKIHRVEDLSDIQSFGFRGEALPSIASVSTLVLTTGTEDGQLTEIIVEAGKTVSEKSVAGPRGTTIRVENLFLNTPARLKFLKTDATELSACVEAVSKAAIANPQIAFTLRHHNSVLVQTSGQDNLETAVAEIWGREVARALVPIDLFNGTARVTGLVSPPHFTKPTRSMQWFFVNGRPVKNRTLIAAVDQAYRSLTPERRYPVGVILVDIAPERVDVNVSPTKSEVKFHQEGAVFDAVRRGIKEGILAGGMVPTFDQVAAANEALLEHRQVSLMPGISAGPIAGSGLAGIPTDQPISPLGASTEPQLEQSPKEKFLDGLRVLGSIDKTFIIAENRTNLLVIDQHVAHERILYEMLCRTRGSTAIESQPLLTPETVTVDKRVASVLSERLDDLRDIGFDMEPFGADSFLLRAVPALGRRRTPREVLQDLIDEITDGSASSSLIPTRDEVYIMCSCKMAIKAGDQLGHAEMEKLLLDLAESENPYLCPHGRPITIVLPKNDLLRRFHRA